MADPAADPVADLLRKTPTTPKQRADAWDAFHASANTDDLAETLKALNLPQSVKADLWDLKAGQRPSTISSVSPEEPGTYAAGAWKGFKEGVVGGLKGYAEEFVPAVGRAALGLIPSTIQTIAHPIQTVQQTVEAVKAIPEAVQHAAVDPEQWGRQVANLTGQAELAVALPAAVKGARVRLPGVRVTPQVAAETAFAEARGIPVDVPTALGSPVAKTIQTGVEHTPLGAVVGHVRKGQLLSALERTGQELATETGVPATTRELAGASVREAVRQTVKQHGATATTAYKQLEALAPGMATVDLQPVKQGVQFIYNRLKQEAAVAPLMGGKAEALRALDRLVTAPDTVPMMTAEAALGDLKTIARTSVPELRTAGEGIAAKAVSELQATIDAHATAAGNQAFELLKQARSSTVAKHQVGAFLKRFSKVEDVGLANRLLAAGDQQIGALRQVAQVAPQKLRDLGRAFIDEQFAKATAEGGWAHTDALFTAWNNLGPETKRLLFSPSHAADLDRFFSLTKRIGKDVNPSGTAKTIIASSFVTSPFAWVLGLPSAVGATISSGTVAALLASPRVARALTRGMTMQFQMGPKMTTAVRAAVWGDVLKAAKDAGVDLQSER